MSEQAWSSRRRVAAAIKHTQPDRVPVDFGGTAVTGIHVSAVTQLRQRVLGEKDYRVRVIEPYQMLGEVDDALRAALGIDVVGVTPRKTMFGTEAGGLEAVQAVRRHGVPGVRRFQYHAGPGWRLADVSGGGRDRSAERSHAARGLFL